MLAYFSSIVDTLVPSESYNPQPGDLKAWLLNAGHGGLIANVLIGLCVSVVAVVMCIRMAGWWKDRK